MNPAFTGVLSYWFLQTIAMGMTALLIPNLRITSLFGAVGIVIALAFGVAIAFFVTLLLVPAMYTIGVDIGRTTANGRDRVLGWFGKGPGPGSDDTDSVTHHAG